MRIDAVPGTLLDTAWSPLPCKPSVLAAAGISRLSPPRPPAYRRPRMTDYIHAGPYVGCGKIEAPQPCIGVCQDRKILTVGKDDYERALATARNLQRQLHGTHALLAQLAWSVPRGGQWELSWRALQARARELLATLATTDIELAGD